MRAPLLPVILIFACSNEPGGAAASPDDMAAQDLDPGSPGAARYLDPVRYDCRARGPFSPPPRPHPAACHVDPSCGGRLIAAHRMGNPFAPENSLSALRASILLGVDMVETDIRLTADGHVVLLHDGDIARTTTGTGKVAGMSLAELRRHPLKVEDGDPAGDFSCERVPTMEEALSLAEGKIIVELEVKASAAGVAAARYLRERGLYRGAFLLCDADECAALRAEVPDAPIMTRPTEPSEVPAALRYAPPPLIVHIDPSRAFYALIPEIRAAGAKVYGNAFAVADPQAILFGDLSGYGPLFEAGLDVVQTEFPHLALTALGRLARD